MNTFNLYAVYFSPTGTSRTNVITIAEEFGDDVSEIDLTIFDNEPTKTNFGKNDIIVFGAPVYGGRIYRKLTSEACIICDCNDDDFFIALLSGCSDQKQSNSDISDIKGSWYNTS